MTLWNKTLWILKKHTIIVKLLVNFENICLCNRLFVCAKEIIYDFRRLTTIDRSIDGRQVLMTVQSMTSNLTVRF